MSMISKPKHTKKFTAEELKKQQLTDQIYLQ